MAVTKCPSLLVLLWRKIFLKSMALPLHHQPLDARGRISGWWLLGQKCSWPGLPNEEVLISLTLPNRYQLKCVVLPTHPYSGVGGQPSSCALACLTAGMSLLASCLPDRIEVKEKQPHMVNSLSVTEDDWEVALIFWGPTWQREV